MAGKWDIVNNPLREGGSFKRIITLRRKDTGIPINLTGCQVSMTITTKDNKMNLSGISISNPLEGQITINYVLPIGIFNFRGSTSISGYHQIDIRFSNGDIIPYLEGTITIKSKI